MRPSGCIAVGVSVHWCLDPARHTWEEYFLLWLFARMNEGGFLCQHALTKESKFNLESCSSREAKAVDNVNEYNIVVRYGACQKITSCYVCHERYLINHLLSTILGGGCFVVLFRQSTEQPHQGDMNNSTSMSKC